MFLCQVLVTFNNDVVVECSLRYAHLSLDKRLFAVRNSKSLSWANFSNNLETPERTEIGLYLLIPDCCPDLNIGVTLAIFHISGNIMA